MHTTKRTRHTLLRRACDPADAVAWDEFVGQYRRFIFYILQQVGIPQRDIEDVAQQILVTLTKKLNSYDRSRSKFRTWFGAVIRHAAFAHLEKLEKNEVRMRSFGEELHFENRGDAPPELDKVIEREWTTYISTLAMERVRAVFEGQAVEVLELTLDGLSGAEIAERTGLSIPSIYTLRKRAKKRLYLEVRAITEELEP